MTITTEEQSIEFYHKIIMVLREFISVHGLIAGSSNSEVCGSANNNCSDVICRHLHDKWLFRRVTYNLIFLMLHVIGW
jgi:hypothetical protein